MWRVQAVDAPRALNCDLGIPMHVEVDDRLRELQVVALGKDVSADKKLRRTLLPAPMRQRVTASPCRVEGARDGGTLGGGRSAVHQRDGAYSSFGAPSLVFESRMDVLRGVPELTEQQGPPTSELAARCEQRSERRDLSVCLRLRQRSDK